MTYEIKRIIEMKNETNNLGMNVYDWFFNNLENNYLSKLDGNKRNVSILEGYDLEAQTYIIHQLFNINEEAAQDLMKELEIEQLFISDENAKHINKP